ncbi:MAG: hypothetical protein II454_10000 [Bacteroidales bacterium]|jgi:hypothetical protein|nr:hypothetical protein [Bacteroidales bacterium]MBQ2173504.1 hypothetical protein [Bacteroidales bacterium]
MKIYHFLSVMLALCLSVTIARAQQPQTPEQREKQLLEYVDKEVQRLSTLLELEYWQEFYVDSTLTHDYKAMNEEMEKMQGAKVENSDLYINVQDKWMQQIDDTYKRLFTADQWAKYWKSGGKRAQEARDKRNKKKK